MNSNQTTFSPCQEKALNILASGSDNVFVTGRAGTGKSFLIRHFLQDKDSKIFPVLASTGAAAIIVGGRTFHSFFGLGIMEGGHQKTVEKALKDKRLVKRLRKINGFVLDEVSMIPSSALNAAEEICRGARQKEIPWGGARVVAVGDFAQLPPVTKSGQKREWAFLAEAWTRSYFKPAVLETMMRTNDVDFLNVLNFIREGVVNDEVRLFLNRRTDPGSDDLSATRLFARREPAETFNISKLGEIKKPVQTFATVYTGAERFVEQLKKNAPIPETLQIKESALVMIRINDQGYRFVNGSIGTVIGISDEEIAVKLKNGRVVEITPHCFTVMDANGDEVASATNFPVNLAYASTIHKAQGATLDSMVCDLRQLWEPGQAYVAISRLKSGKDLTLTGWDENSIRVDADVMRFHEGLK